MARDRTPDDQPTVPYNIPPAAKKAKHVNVPESSYAAARALFPSVPSPEEPFLQDHIIIDIRIRLI